MATALEGKMGFYFICISILFALFALFAFQLIYFSIKNLAQKSPFSSIFILIYGLPLGFSYVESYVYSMKKIHGI